MYGFGESNEVIFIDGTIDNEIVIGYGDEHDQIYKDIENLFVDEYLEYTKSPFYSIDPR